MEIGGRLPNSATALQSHIESHNRAQNTDITARKQEFAQLLQVDAQIAQRAMRHTSEQVRTRSVKPTGLPKRRRGGGSGQQLENEEDLVAAQESALSEGGLDPKKIFEMQCAVFGQFLANRQSEMRDNDEDEES